jgi:hypothetical protein
MKYWKIALVTLPFALACDKDPEPEAALPPAEPAAEPSPAPAAVEEDPTDRLLEQIPTSVDFEEEAIEEINAENMEEELDRLEAEIAG